MRDTRITGAATPGEATSRTSCLGGPLILCFNQSIIACGLVGVAAWPHAAMIPSTGLTVILHRHALHHSRSVQDYDWAPPTSGAPPPCVVQLTNQKLDLTLAPVLYLFTQEIQYSTQSVYYSTEYGTVQCSEVQYSRIHRGTKQKTNRTGRKTNKAASASASAWWSC